MKRRYFFQRMLLPLAGLTLRGLPALAGQNKLDGQDRDGRTVGQQDRIGKLHAREQGMADKLIQGKVRAGNRSLSGVVVSDGYSVVQTDAQGHYGLTLHPDAVSVFVSVPSGYHFPQERNIVRHYIPVKKLKEGIDQDFVMDPLEKDDAEHTFILWADPQVKDEKDVAKMMAGPVPDVRQYVNGLAPGTLVHGISVGDLVWDNHDLFVSYEEAVHKIGIPFFQCLGNHDMDYHGTDDDSDNTFQELYGPTYYSFNRGKVHYVVMDNVRYLGTGRDFDGYINENQLQWLEKDLALVPRDHLFIICMHIPVHNEVKNNDALYNILKRLQITNAHIMTGHTHYHRNVIREGYYEHNHGTVCGAWWTGPICGDGTPSGYGIYKVKGTDLSWHYKSWGFPLDHQMTLHLAPGAEGGQQLLANVWNADAEWSVTCSADGRDLGEMVRIRGYDPVAYSLYLGPDNPHPRGFVEPVLTDHLYSVTIPAGTRQLRVEAIDRFGQLYAAEREVKG